MNEENTDNNNSENLENQGTRTRDAKGHLLPGFNPQIEAGVKTGQVSQGGSPPITSDYTKMNSYLAKQLGIADKLADFQTKFEPQDLFKQLSFMADNSEFKPTKQQNGGLPPNQQIAALSPKPGVLDGLPGTIIGKPNLSDEKFSLHLSMDPKKLLSGKK